MNPSYTKILDYYEEGRITPTGAILRLLNITDQGELKEALDVMPPELLERFREFVATWRPDMQVFRGPPPNIDAVRMARELLANPAKST